MGLASPPRGATPRWMYKGGSSSIERISRARFKINYGFTASSTTDLVILLTPLYKHADNVISVEQVQTDHCVVCIRDSQNRSEEETNFYFMIIEFYASINRQVTDSTNLTTSKPIDRYPPL